MTKHYLLIPKEHEEQTYETVDILPIDVQLDMAEYEVAPEDLAKYFNIANGNALKAKDKKISTEPEYIKNSNREKDIKYAKEIVEAFTSPDYIVVTYDNGIYNTGMAEDDNTVLTCNDELLINVKRNDVGYSVDVYNQKKQNDEGLFGSITVFDEDLDEDE